MANLTVNNSLNITKKNKKIRKNTPTDTRFNVQAGMRYGSDGKPTTKASPTGKYIQTAYMNAVDKKLKKC